MPTVKNYLIDMDGVLISGNTIIPGADEFIKRLREHEAKFLVLTNNSRYTPRDLAHNLQRIGLDIPFEQIFTSAMATAHFLHTQKATGTAFVVGESGLTDAIHSMGYVITEHEPDFVVLGETTTYNTEMITRAVRLVVAGSRFVATNPDPTGPTEHGVEPACGAWAALIEKASGKSPLFIGKPNPFMMRSALNYLGVHSENTVMIGDRMDTDIIAGVQTGLETILVLSGVTRIEEVTRFPYLPTQIARSVAEIQV
jgi:NagD protein